MKFVKSKFWVGQRVEPDVHLDKGNGLTLEMVSQKDAMGSEFIVCCRLSRKTTS
jgi:hypothetical protein